MTQRQTTRQGDRVSQADKASPSSPSALALFRYPSPLAPQTSSSSSWLCHFYSYYYDAVSLPPLVQVLITSATTAVSSLLLRLLFTSVVRVYYDHSLLLPLYSAVYYYHSLLLPLFSAVYYYHSLLLPLYSAVGCAQALTVIFGDAPAPHSQPHL